MKPYIEEHYEKHGTKESYKIRTFKDECDSIWFKEEDTQRVRVFSGHGWRLQIGDTQPILLEQGEKYNIPKNRFHRIIKGEGNLVIRLEII